MTTAQALATTPKPTAFEMELAQYEPQIAAALPQHISVDRFKRVVITALNQNPDLWQADRRSLFTSCVRAAQDGLFPDGREAALVIFNTKNRKTNQWENLVTYMPMVAGIIKRMRNSGDVAAVDTQVVHENDEFDYELGDNPRIHHKPTLGDPGKPIAAYAIIKLTNGEVLREVMSFREIEKVRAVSKAKDNGPWVAWWTEMARKTALRRCAKRAPVSSDLDAVLRREDADDLADHERGEHIVSIPARPTRAAFVEPEQKPKSFTIVTNDGEPVEWASAEEAQKALVGQMDEAAARGGQKSLDGIWETNAVTVTQIRDANTALAEALQAHFTETSKGLAAPKKGATEAAQPAKAQTQPADAGERDGIPASLERRGPKAETAKPKETKPAAEIPPRKEPLDSPFNYVGPERKAAWPVFVGRLVEELAALPSLKEQQIVLATYKQEFGRICEDRPDDLDRINAVLRHE